MNKLLPQNNKNSSKEALTSEDKYLIEQLVDDELSVEDRRKILERLEHTSNGWKFCAITFLEAQALRSSFRSITSSNKYSRNQVNDVPKGISARQNWHSLKVVLPAISTIAATILCMVFVLRETPSSSVPRNEITKDMSSPVSQTSADIIVSPPNEPNSFIPRFTIQENTPIRTVTLNCPKHGLTNISASCVESQHFDSSIFNSINEELPTDLTQQLTENGGSINAQRDEYRFSLDDGRVLILPVDTYNVKYVPPVIW